MSKGGQIQPGGGGPRGDFGDPVYDAGNNGTMLGGLPPSLYNGLNQMPSTHDFGPARAYGSPYAPTPMMSQPGAINDPTVNAALAVLNRSQPGNQMPGLMPMMMPAMRGSGVSDQVRQYNFGLVPETPYQTATYSTPAAPVDSGAGSDSGGMDVGVDNGFSSLSPSDQAAYYAENPTMGSIGRVGLAALENSLPGAAIGYFDPGAFTTNDAIMAGMDPTGWQFAGRESDGLMGTQIGGTLSFPALSPENYGSHGEVGAVYGPTVAESATPSVPSWGQSESAAAGVTGDAPYGGYVTDGSGNVVTDGSGNPFGYGEGHANAAAAEAASQAAAEAAYGEQAEANAQADAAAADAAVAASGDAGQAASVSGVSEGQAAANAADAAAVASAEAGMAASIGGGGGDGDKIICTAMNQAYGFGSFRNAIWIAYADKHLSKAHEVGYHALFLPLVDYAFKRGDGKLNLAVRKVLEWGTRHRSTDLRAEMRGTKRDTTGRIIRFIFEPLCYAAGKLKGY